MRTQNKMAGIAGFLPTNLARLLNLDKHGILSWVLAACSLVWKDSGAEAGLVSMSPPGLW